MQNTYLFLNKLNLYTVFSNYFVMLSMKYVISLPVHGLVVLACCCVLRMPIPSCSYTGRSRWQLDLKTEKATLPSFSQGTRVPLC